MDPERAKALRSARKRKVGGQCSHERLADLLGAMARRAATGDDHAQLRRLDPAALDGKRAARVEGAGLRGIGRGGDLAGNRPECRRAALELRHRLHERLGIRVPRRRVDRRRRPALDDAAEIHHRDTVAEMPHDAEIVRDEQHRQIELAAQAQEQVDDLRLDRNVERGDRLVADEEVGLHGERAGDGDPLALPAGELVRIAADIVRIEPDRLEPCSRDSAGLLSLHQPVRQRPLEDGLADTHARVERGEGVLEHGLDPRRQLAAARRDRGAVEKHATLARHQDAGDDAAEGRLAAARLADEAERLAARDRE